MARHSIWWKTGVCVASRSSVRNTLPGRHDVDRRLLLEHRADLDRRRLRAQHEARVDRVEEEGVLHLPGRVVGPEVEGVEVEPLALELRTLGDLPAHADEGVDEALGDELDAGGARRAAPQRGHGDVDALLDEDALVALGLELGLAGRQRLADAAPGLADALAGLGLGARRQRTDLAVGEGERALLPLVRDAHGLEVVEGRRCGDRRERVLHRCVDVRRVECGDLDGVVVRVGSGHRRAFAALARVLGGCRGWLSGWLSCGCPV